MFAKENYRGLIFATLATLLWAGNFVVSKSLYQDYSPVHLSFWRWTFAFILLLPFSWRRLTVTKLAVARRHLGFLFIASLFGMSLQTFLVYQAAHTTSATNQTLIGISAPVFVLLGGWLIFHRVPSLQTLLGIVVSYLGIYFLISKGGSAGITPGDGLMLVAAASFSVYTLMMQKQPIALDALLVLTLMAGCAAFQCGILYLLMGSLGDVSGFHLPGKEIGALLYFAIGPSILGYLFWGKAINEIGCMKAAYCYFLLPVYGAAMAVTLLGEGISLLQVVSYLFIVAGVFMSVKGDRVHVREYA
ncbi:Uncharacterised protein [BD1-7 clade bacterium]|uniref:EamA domain-containing protein n=1 Tax=BD1-7 clade bacterium TaxID=2029982 RepID=A0A5S9R0Z4_9GAMM|nr:Uncharacterised protein [BD1-7 clade bacterium]